MIEKIVMIFVKVKLDGNYYQRWYQSCIEMHLCFNLLWQRRNKKVHMNNSNVLQTSFENLFHKKFSIVVDAPAHSFKLHVAQGNHLGEVHWKEFQSDILSSLPHQWSSSQNSHFFATRFDKRRNVGSVKTDMIEPKKKGKIQRKRSNVIVSHLSTGMEVTASFWNLNGDFGGKNEKNIGDTFVHGEDGL